MTIRLLSIARQITEAFPWDEAPPYLIRDRDPRDIDLLLSHNDCKKIYNSVLHRWLARKVMFSLVKDLGVQVALKQEAVPFIIAFLIAEFLFKFKSFTLECLAFLATWFVLSYLQSLVFPRTQTNQNR